MFEITSGCSRAIAGYGARLVFRAVVAPLVLAASNPSVAFCVQDDLQAFARIRADVEEAERSADVERLRLVYADSVLLLASDFPPVLGADAVAEFMQLLFERFDIQTRYTPDTTALAGDSAVESGVVRQVWTPRSGEEATTDVRPYRWVYVRNAAGSWTQSRIVWGEPASLASRVPQMPAPTGPHPVGRRNLYLVDQTRLESFTADPDDHREVALQVWYPAVRAVDREPARSQSREATLAAAAFLGWPLWWNSYHALIETHAVEGAEYAELGAPFPVLLYNHGYSGFTTVHTALLEDVASHGYVAVSVGHAYESALFVVQDGSVRTFSPDNVAYRARIEGIWAIPVQGGEPSLVVAYDRAEIVAARWLSVGPDRLYLPVRHAEIDIWVADVEVER